MIKQMFVVRDRGSHNFTSNIILADSELVALRGFSEFCNSAALKIDKSCYEFVKIGEIEENGHIIDTSGKYLANGTNFDSKLKQMISCLSADEEF